MKTKFNGILTLLLALTVQFVFAQKTVSGTVSDDSGPLPGVSVIIKGSKSGTETDFDGKYSIQAKQGDVLQFSYVGKKTEERTVGSANSIDVSLEDGANVLDEVVITAMGIKKEKKALGYATQEVKGDEISNTPVTNFAEALAGEVAGLDIQTYGSFGGSANIIVRGYNSISSSNQALIVIDGTPVLNETGNSGNVTSGRGGYDYGNAAMDLNPDDIANVNVLKGAAATALYGSRASNGAIIITTKKGKGSKGLGVTFNSSVTVGRADMETLPVYQKKYGAGYGPYYDDPYFLVYDLDGDSYDDQVVPFTEDASYGAAFDPNLNVYQWTAIFPELPGYHIKTPWVGAENDPNSMWETALTTTNSLSFGKSTEETSFRLGYTNKIQEGILPNSSIDRNTVSLAGSQKFGAKTSASVDFSYTNTQGKGRNGTGYDSNNPMQSFRQWFQTNVDIQEQKDAFFNYGRKNYTWNVNSDTDLAPIYTDNVYWVLYKNFETDSRDRYMGNFTLNQEVTEWFNITGRYAFDAYSEIREERTEVGSSNVSSYVLRNRKLSETNFDLMGNFNHSLSDDLTLDGLIGFNYRLNKFNSLAQNTNGGLITPGLFTLSNSVNALTADNIAKVDYTKKVDGIFAKAGIAYKGTYYLDGTVRRDRSSSLPADNNVYYYPSVSTSIIVSNLIKQPWLSFAKLRANYAEVGNDTDPYQIFNTYGIGSSFDGNATASNPTTLNNPDLKSEKSKDIEVGIETQLFKNRLGFDISYYKRSTIDLITPIDVSTATGASRVWLNGADMDNKGFEVMMNITPLKTDKFSWDMKFNYAKNESEITRLAEGIQYIQLASVQGGVSIGAQLGEAFGVLRGKDFIYDSDGNKVISTSGYYRTTTTSNNVIGDINPDWTGSVKNTLKYKNMSLGFLIDIQKGGDVFSLDTYYGYATGLYDFTAGNNELGNPVRNSNANGGGVLLDGVQGTVVFNADGSYTVSNTSPNTVRGAANTYANPWGYVRNPQAAFVYDASFVKLREVNFTFDFNDKITERLKLQDLSLSLIGRNLWIIHKNVPYADPEAGLGAGNIQGYQSGAYPSVKEFGASLKVEF